MSKKVGNNEKCPCGSGLKYKKCCKFNEKQQKATQTPQSEWNDWITKVSNLPFRAEIRTENGASGSMMVNSASVTKDGAVQELFNDQITLSINQGEGDKMENSYAIISIPQDKKAKPEIQIVGNAYVKNTTEPYNIAIKDSPRELKIKSPNGLFAIIKIVLRRDCGFNCFDLLFGEAGRKEIKNEDGIKERPHLTIFPDGNNKFFRLVGYKCKMEGKLEYEASDKTIYPINSIIVFDEYSEKLVLSFTYKKDINTIELYSAKFE
jgi:hypothetical protein